MSEDNYGECNDCPSNTEGPNQCSVIYNLKQSVNMYSGTENKIEIQVTKCHHKARILKEVNRNE